MNDFVLNAEAAETQGPEYREGFAVGQTDCENNRYAAPRGAAPDDQWCQGYEARWARAFFGKVQQRVDGRLSELFPKQNTTTK